MAYDPALRSETLSEAFKEAPNRGLDCAEMVESGIPDDREPEISFLLKNMSMVHTIYEALAASPDVIILPGSERLGSESLVSLCLDTVYTEGNIVRPMRDIEKSGHTLRSRFGYFEEGPDGGALRDFDRSVKTNTKSILRKEWEATGTNLQDGYDVLLTDNPTLPAVFSQVDPESFRVSSVCLASRGVYSILHLMPEFKAAVVYDLCNDGCVMATPHADHPVGYRKEFEAEAKSIYSADMAADDTEGQHRLLDASLARIKEIVMGAAPGEIRETSESKMQHAQRVVKQFYESRFRQGLIGEGNGENATNMDGLDIALMQNVRPEDFEGKKTNLQLLSRLIPRAQDLLPEKRSEASYEQFFDKHQLRRPLL